MAAREAVDFQGEPPFRINIERLRRERTERARKSLKKNGLDGILCFLPENIRYATSAPGSYALLPVDGDPVVAHGGMTQEHLTLGAPWLNVQTAIPVLGMVGNSLALNRPARDRQMKKLASHVKEMLKDAKLNDETVGIDISPSPSMREAFDKEEIKTSPTGSQAMAEARMIKTRDEVECMRVAASIVDACFLKVRENVKPGVTENDLWAIVNETVYRLGADRLEPSGAHCESGPFTWPRGGAGHTDRIIRPGDLVYLDILALYLGYTTCYYRTFVCGKPTQAQKDTYKQVHDWLYDAIKVMKPGATTKEVAEKWPRAQEFGRPNEDAACMMQWGHAIGLTRYEPPAISRIWSLDYPDKIEANMVIAVETINGTGERTPEYPNGQGIRLEEMVHITETGNEVLSKWPIDEITVCEL